MILNSAFQHKYMFHNLLNFGPVSGAGKPRAPWGSHVAERVFLSYTNSSFYVITPFPALYKKTSIFPSYLTKSLAKEKRFRFIMIKKIDKWWKTFRLIIKKIRLRKKNHQINIEKRSGLWFLKLRLTTNPPPPWFITKISISIYKYIKKYSLPPCVLPTHSNRLAQTEVQRDLAFTW